MGFEIKFNWALQIEPANDLRENEIYSFTKKGSRVFPLETSIDLISPTRVAIAKIQIMEFSTTKTETIGKYKIIRIYKGEEKNILTNYWIENE